MPDLGGIFPAIITPFDERGRLDLGELDAFLDFQRAAGVDGFCATGTNGEGTSLSVQERKDVLDAMLAHAGGLPVIAGTGACSLADALELTQYAGRAGAAAVLVLPSFFFPQATARGLAEYFLRVLDASTVPVFLYNIPQFSRVPITDDTLALIADHPNLSGIKDSAGDWDRSRQLLARKDISMYCGEDTLLARFAAAGALGCISGVCNALPELIVAVWRARHCPEELEREQERLNAACRVFVQYPIVGNSKAILAHRGVIHTHARPPLVDLDAGQAHGLIAGLRDLGILT